MLCTVVIAFLGSCQAPPTSDAEAVERARAALHEMYGDTVWFDQVRELPIEIVDELPGNHVGMAVWVTRSSNLEVGPWGSRIGNPYSRDRSTILLRRSFVIEGDP